jgi:MFS family permease
VSPRQHAVHPDFADALGSVLWLIPALLVDGAGMGIVIAPLGSTVLARVQPEHVGSASGVLNTAVQMGVGLGVAIVGLIFYPVLGSGGSAAYPHAFAFSLLYLLSVCVSLIMLVQLLPKHATAEPGYVSHLTCLRRCPATDRRRTAKSWVPHRRLARSREKLFNVRTSLRSPHLGGLLRLSTRPAEKERSGPAEKEKSGGLRRFPTMARVDFLGAPVPLSPHVSEQDYTPSWSTLDAGLFSTVNNLTCKLAGNAR